MTQLLCVPKDRNAIKSRSCVCYVCLFVSAYIYEWMLVLDLGDDDEPRNVQMLLRIFIYRLFVRCILCGYPQAVAGRRGRNGAHAPANAFRSGGVRASASSVRTR